MNKIDRNYKMLDNQTDFDIELIQSRSGSPEGPSHTHTQV